MATPSHSNSCPSTPLSASTFSTSPERAQAYLAHHGVLILDDNLSQLEAVAAVCADVFAIPSSRIVLIHARPGVSLHNIINEATAAFARHLEQTGGSFGGIITDYNLSGGITSLEVWRAVDAAFKAPDRHEHWQRTGRVLMSASPRESDIIAAEESHLIDRYIAKPFKLSTLEDALVASVLRRLSK